MLRWTLSNATFGSVILDHDPKGWEDIELKFNRDKEFHGLFYEFTFEVGFYCKGGGKEFVDHCYEKIGINALINILIEYSCDSGFDEVYTGVLNMETYRREESYTYINIEQEGLTQILKSRKDTKVDLQLTESIDGTLIQPLSYGFYQIGTHSKSIGLGSEIEKGADTLVYDETYDLTLNSVNTRFIQPRMQAIKKNLAETTANPELDIISTNDATPCDPDVTSQPVPYQQLSPFHDSTNNNLVIYPATYTISWNMVGSLLDSMPIDEEPRSINYKLRILRGYSPLDYYNLDPNPPGEVIDLVTINYDNSPSPAPITTPFNVTGSTTIVMQPGDKLFLHWIAVIVMNGGSSPSCQTIQQRITMTSARVTISIDSEYPDGLANGYLIHEAFTKNLEIITNENDCFRSDFFGRTNANEPVKKPFELYSTNGCGAFTFITNGHQLRQADIDAALMPIPLLTKPVYASLSDLFKSQDMIWNIGLGVEKINGLQKVRIEQKRYFYDDTVIFTAYPASVKMSLDLEKNYRQIKIGYKYWNADTEEGLDEPLTKREYTTWNNRIDNDYVQDNPYIGAMYLIEIKRRQTNLTADKAHDDTNFVIAINRDVDSDGIPQFLQAPEKSADFTVVGLNGSSSAYNLRFTPARALLRHAYIISSGFTKDANAIVKFTYGEGNYTMQSAQVPDNCDGDYNGVTLSENLDFSWTDVNIDNRNPLFIPEIYEFDVPVPYSQFRIIKANPKGTVKFSTDGVNFKSGFILSLSYKLRIKMATFVLIRKY